MSINHPHFILYISFLHVDMTPPGIAIAVFILQTEHLRDVSLTQVGLPQLLLRLRSCSFLFNVAPAHGEKTKAGHVLTCLVTGFDLLLVWE